MGRPQAVVTGASSGIGAAMAPMLAGEGYDLLLVARREAELAQIAGKATAEVPGARAETLPLDLTERGAAERLLERAPDARLVVNSAGFGYLGPALSADLDTYRRMIALNCAALTEVTYLYAKRMAGQGGGTIFNIASSAAFQPIPGFAVYAATKAYVVSLCEGLNYELRSKGVHVLAYCPGPVDTAFEAAAGVPPEMVAYNKRFLITADHCARVAVEAIRRRKETVVPGFYAGLGAFMSRVIPRRLVRWASAELFHPPIREE